MIHIIQNKDIYEISFKYDANLVTLIKNVPSRNWIPEKKKWVIDKDKLGFLINQLKGTVYENQINLISDENINVNAELGSTKTIPEIDISDVNFQVKEGCKPFKHQIDFMKYSIDRSNRGLKSGFILGDDPGLGKTVEVTNLALYRRQQGYKRCLVICCINSSKYNWEEDIIDHTKGAEKPYILGSRFKRDKVSVRCDTGGNEKYQDLSTGYMYGNKKYGELPYFIIMNIEGIRTKKGKKYVVADEIIRLINEGEINMIAIDEIHKNASPKSIQGKQLLRIKKSIKRNVEWIPMTGTPIVNKPTDVFTPLRLVDGHNYASYYTWCQQFCIYGGFGDHEILGYKNIPMLKQMLEKNMLRRLRSDVLDLPPKVRQNIYVENTEYQKKLYTQVQNDMNSNRQDIINSLNPMTKFLRLRQVNGSPELVDDTLRVDSKYLSKNAKLVAVLNQLEQIAQRGEKTIIYSNWVEPLRTLYKFVSKQYKVCCFTGTMTSEEREKHKRVFINNPNYTVMIGTIGALGTTHTLTVANNVIFYDEPWTPSDRKQAEDRIYRIGTKSTVNIYTILSHDTIDDKVHDILYTKSGISNYIVDGKLDLKGDPKLLDMLLS